MVAMLRHLGPLLDRNAVVSRVGCVRQVQHKGDLVEVGRLIHKRTGRGCCSRSP
jgi:hypothetical protein